MVTIARMRFHILNSNAIEGIRTRSGPLYDNHFYAARAVALNPAKFKADPCLVHRMCFGNIQFWKDRGRLRKQPVWIGVGKNRRKQVLPHSLDVPALLEEWAVASDELLFTPYQQGDLDNKELVGRANLLHALLLCIHPFSDGNGRVSRLIHNAQRLTVGLPWYTVRYQERRRYYAYIRAIEKSTFPLFREIALDSKSA
ncbi:MAG: Fic family protein [Patescibacteria group bacterium]